ncbi:hypothetical protein [Halovivax limisalsi]|uniref:hypothetical protein n=1 Tax=Halovivax limisalsi TaxID=1453760 RepID=UPI001FFD1671|nr:hypothetical protein [Halovivax limisalsi]
MGSEDSGKIEYAIGINSCDVEAVDIDDDDIVSTDCRHDGTNIWGSVWGDTDTYRMSSDAQITYLEASSGYWACDDVHKGCGPQLTYTCEGAGNSSTDWELEVTDASNSGGSVNYYSIYVTDKIEGDGGQEHNDWVHDGWVEGYVGGGDEDHYEMSGNFDYISIYPFSEEVRIDRYELD